MGTSADYGGAVGGGWTSYKRAISNFTRHGGGENGERAQRVVSRYVAATGGTAGLGANGSAQRASTAARGLAGFLSGFASGGLDGALREVGLGHLVGKSRWEVVDAIIDALVGDGATRESQAVVSAMVKTFQDLFPDTADSYAELDETSVAAADIPALIEKFLVEWAYAELASTCEQKFANLDAATDAALTDELRGIVRSLVHLELADNDPVSVDWRAEEGGRIVQSAIEGAWKIAEEDLAP